MALLIRSSSCSTCFSGQIPGRTHFSGKQAVFRFKMEKFASSFRASKELLPSPFLGLRMSNVHANKSDGNSNLVYQGSDQDTITGSFFAHQGHAKLTFSEMALILTNTMILTTPFEAMAQTCENENSLFNMPLLLFVAIVGATVGGLVARQRKGELKRVNEQLRQINAALRRQAKIESYAPTLSYAPVGARITEDEVIVDPRKQELISRLKTGKNYLRNQNPENALEEFKAALELAQTIKDPVEEKKAARGLGASLQRQGKFKEAIKYHTMVLSISKRVGEESGNTEAYGAIADCYTELGDLEQAGKFYDKYIAHLEKD